MTPFASMIAFFAASTTLSGVSLGQLMMTDLCGTDAMAKAARSATRRAVSVKRIVAVVRDSGGCSSAVVLRLNRRCLRYQVDKV